MSLTAIITSSYIKSHPNIDIIKETIESLTFINKNNIDIIISQDYSDNKDYKLYLENLKNYIKTLNYKNIKLLVSEKHVHLTGVIRNSINYVNTKYILLIQHDLPFIRSFNIDSIMSDMDEKNEIKYVRFNKRKNIKLIFDSINDLFGKEINGKNNTYTRTPAWSDNNHLCLTSYYKDLILKECIDGIPMEEQIHGRSINEIEHSKWGTYLFGKNNEDAYIKHSDGKNYKMKEKHKPYMNSDEISDLVTYIDRDSEMLEIGCGNSALFFSKIVKRLVIIEHNKEWSDKISNDMKSISKCDWSIHVVEPSFPQSHPFQPSEPGQFDNYINFISNLEKDQFDVILIDGRDRVRSTIASIPLLKKGGILLIHDFWNRPKYHSVLQLSELELIKDNNSYINSENTLVALRKK